MNSDALKYLLEISETGSFNKAAQQLFISQPALRSTISNLEKELGGKLLNRSKYGCTLTTFGKKVVNEAPLILNLLSNWKQFAETHNPKDNEIIIYATKPFCSSILVPTITTLQNDLPYSNLKIISANFVESINKLKKAACQIAIIHSDIVEESSLRSHLQLDQNFIIENLLDDQFFIAINKTDPLAKKEKLSEQDLLSYTYIGISSPEMLTMDNLFQVGLNASERVLLDTHHSMFKVINNNIHYYSILSSIFLINQEYQLFDNVIFKPISNLQNNAKFYLIYSQTIDSYDTQKAIDTIRLQCKKVTSLQ